MIAAQTDDRNCLKLDKREKLGQQNTPNSSLDWVIQGLYSKGSLLSERHAVTWCAPYCDFVYTQGVLRLSQIIRWNFCAVNDLIPVLVIPRPWGCCGG